MPFDGTTYQVSKEIQTIIKMRELIEQYGHAHGAYKTKNGYCLMGAYITCRGTKNREPEFISLILKELPAKYCSIVNWNDTHNKKEVLALLDKVIEKNLHPHETHALSHG